MAEQKYTPEMLAEARTMFEAGNSLCQIGKRFGVSSATVKRWVNPKFAAEARVKYRRAWSTFRLKRDNLNKLQAEAKRRGLSAHGLMQGLIELAPTLDDAKYEAIRRPKPKARPKFNRKVRGNMFLQAKAAAMDSQGASRTEIARRLGVTTEVVRGWLGAQGKVREAAE